MPRLQAMKGVSVKTGIEYNYPLDMGLEPCENRLTFHEIALKTAHDNEEQLL